MHEFLEQAAIGLYRVTPDGRFLLANQAMLHMLGVTSLEELQQQSSEQQWFLTSPARAAFRERVEQEGVVVGIETGWPGRDGATRLVRESCRAIRDGSGRIEYYDGSAEAIKSLGHVDEPLRQREERFRLLLESARDATFWADAETGMILYCNRAAEVLLGRDRSEIIGRHHTMLHPPEQADQHRENFRANPAKTPYRRTEIEVMRKDGVRVPVEVADSVIEVSGRKIVQGVFEDITERKRAERELRESRTLLSNAFNNSPLIMTISDLQTGEYLDVNDSFCRASGFAREEAIGRTSVELGWLSANGCARLLQELRQNGKVAGLELALRTRQGRTLTCRCWGDVIQTANGDRLFSSAEDITERKQWEQELEKSDYRLRKAEELGRIGAWEWDIGTGALTWSDEVFRIYGLDSRTDVPSYDTVLQRLPPELRESFSQSIEAALVDGEPFEGEYRIIRPDGSIRNTYTLGEVIRDDEGAPAKMFGIVQDITERKRAEEALHESERRFRGIFEKAPIGIALTDVVTGRFLRVNQALCDIVGYSQTEMLAHNFRSFTHPDDLPASLEHVDRLNRGLIHFFTTEKRYVRKDGSIVWARVTVTNLQSVGEPSKTHLAMVEDITTRKRAEEALRWTADVSSALAALYVPLVSEDQDCDDLAKTVLVHSLKLTRSELGRVSEIGGGVDHHGRQPVSATTSGEADKTTGGAAPRYGGLWDHALRTRQAVWTNAASIHPMFIGTGPDEPILTRVLCVPVLLDGEPVGQIAVANAARDYTGQDVHAVGRLAEFFALALQHRRANAARLEAERRLLHVQKLEGLGALAGGFAHDFNNLLMVVLGNAQLALDELQPGAPVQDYLRRIETVSQRAASLCRQLLTYSGRNRFAVQPMDLSAVVRETSQLLATATLGKSLHYQLAPRLPVIKGDADQLRQLLVSLVTNAAEAMEGLGGGVTISTGVQHCDDEFLDSCWLGSGMKPGVYVYLSVADTGCGMDDATLARLFDPFFSTKFMGRGLGLAAVSGIVRGHGGAIKVVSSVGVGTTITAFFPFQPAQERLAGGGPDTVPQVGTGTVLLVDDEDAVLEVVGAMLERIGFQVIPVSDAREAAQRYAATRDRIVLVVLDLTMPNLSGEDTLRMIRQVDAGVPVIMVSGYSQQEIASRLIADGESVTFIQKPFSIEQLAAKVREVVEVGRGV